MWNELGNQKYFWFSLSQKVHCLLVFFSGTKKIPVRQEAWPGSITDSSLPMGALDFSKDRENSKSSLHLQPWTFAASPGKLWKLAAIWSMCPKCFSSQTSWRLLYFHLLSLTSPVPQNQAPLWNNHLLLKPRAVTGCKYHWFNLWTLVNEGTLLRLQHPLGFCNNYSVLHGYVCAPQASTSVPESEYTVSCEQEIN